MRFVKSIILTVLCCCACLNAEAQPFASGYINAFHHPMYDFVGKKYVNVTLQGTDKKKHKLSEFVGKGNYVLVDYWASWCGPCMREMPVVRECYARYHKKGFDVLGISLDSAEAEWKQAIKDSKQQWRQFCDFKGFDSPAVTTYMVEAIPWNLLCDGKGYVMAVGLKGEKLLALLQEIYGY